MGKVKDDQLGRIFAHDIRAQGADFNTPMVSSDSNDETGRSMILVSPDGERSMNTYLGVANQLNVTDIDPDLMADTDWLYLEGYLFDRPDSQARPHDIVKFAMCLHKYHLTSSSEYWAKFGVEHSFQEPTPKKDST